MKLSRDYIEFEIEVIEGCCQKVKEYAQSLYWRNKYVSYESVKSDIEYKLKSIVKRSQELLEAVESSHDE